MVLLTCTRCNAEYFEQRFIWELDQDGHIGDHNKVHCAHGCVDGGAAQHARIFKSPGHGAIEAAKGKRPLPPAVYGDAVRATGTVTNVIGSCVTSAGTALAPASAVLALASAACGVVGLASGTYQLMKGLDTPSGRTDPYLLAKGGTTAFVGGTCMLLGASAAFVPALCLGAAGVCAAFVIDANVNGLCKACRNGGHPKATAVDVAEGGKSIDGMTVGPSAFPPYNDDKVKGLCYQPTSFAEEDDALAHNKKPAETMWCWRSCGLKYA